MAQQTKTGRNIRWYANGVVVGMTRMKGVKPDRQQKLEAIKEAGNPSVIEYAKMVPETTLTLDYNIINYQQLAISLGQNVTAAAEVPDIPDNWDIVEKLISAGTEGTTTEAAIGWAVHQGVMVEKESWDQEVDKLISVNISAKSIAPRRFIASTTSTPNGITGVQFDNLTANGVLTTFTLSKKARVLKDGFQLIRSEYPTGVNFLKETVDFTVGGTASTTTVTFTAAPASSSTPNMLFLYVY